MNSTAAVALAVAPAQQRNFIKVHRVSGWLLAGWRCDDPRICTHTCVCTHVCKHIPTCVHIRIHILVHHHAPTCALFHTETSLSLKIKVIKKRPSAEPGTCRCLDTSGPLWSGSNTVLVPTDEEEEELCYSPAFQFTPLSLSQNSSRPTHLQCTRSADDDAFCLATFKALLMPLRCEQRPRAFANSSCDS
jgi:hypothetical protein